MKTKRPWVIQMPFLSQVRLKPISIVSSAFGSILVSISFSNHEPPCDTLNIALWHIQYIIISPKDFHGRYLLHLILILLHSEPQSIHSGRHFTLKLTMKQFPLQDISLCGCQRENCLEQNQNQGRLGNNFIGSKVIVFVPAKSRQWQPATDGFQEIMTKKTLNNMNNQLVLKVYYLENSITRLSPLKNQWEEKTRL